ncbi:unnamed protein product [Sphagnum jensenii]|uniref:Uncharacterized protein n=1 Tax=Sphagnum jensenii TaxID=128206 RepID=A0ABP1AMI3_9BRYO
MSRTSESSSASELDLQVIVPVGRVQFTSMDESNALPDHITLHAHTDDAEYHHPVPAEATSTTCKNTSVSCCTDIVADIFGQDFRFRPASADTSSVQNLHGGGERRARRPNPGAWVQCSGDRGSGLGLAHRSCAVIWFSAKRVRSSVAYEQLTCEVCKCNLAPTISRIVCQHSRSTPVLEYDFVDPVPDHVIMLDVGQLSVGTTAAVQLHSDSWKLWVALLYFVLLLLVIGSHFFTLQVKTHAT